MSKVTIQRIGLEKITMPKMGVDRSVSNPKPSAGGYYMTSDGKYYKTSDNKYYALK